MSRVLVRLSQQTGRIRRSGILRFLHNLIRKIQKIFSNLLREVSVYLRRHIYVGIRFCSVFAVSWHVQTFVVTGGGLFFFTTHGWIRAALSLSPLFKDPNMCQCFFFFFFLPPIFLWLLYLDPNLILLMLSGHCQVIATLCTSTSKVWTLLWCWALCNVGFHVCLVQMVVAWILRFTFLGYLLTLTDPVQLLFSILEPNFTGTLYMYVYTYVFKYIYLYIIYLDYCIEGVYSLHVGIFYHNVIFFT